MRPLESRVIVSASSWFGALTVVTPSPPPKDISGLPFDWYCASAMSEGAPEFASAVPVARMRPSPSTASWVTRSPAVPPKEVCARPSPPPKPMSGVPFSLRR
jgi:hypothetical protein